MCNVSKRTAKLIIILLYIFAPSRSTLFVDRPFILWLRRGSLGREGRCRSATRTGTSCSAGGKTRPVNLGPKRPAINDVFSNELRSAGKQEVRPRVLQMPLVSSSDVGHW